MKGFLDPNFSVEDIQKPIYQSNESLAQSIIHGNGLKEFATIVTDRNNDDYVSYSIEAYTHYNDAILIGQFATEGINHLLSEPQLIKKIKDAYSIETLDPYAFSLEADTKAPQKNLSKKANIFARIFSAIATVFKKLIMTIGNWVRSLMNSIKAGMLKGAAKFYALHEKEFPALLSKYGDNKIKAAIPTGTPDFSKINADSIKDITDKLKNLQDQVTKHIDSIKNAKGAGNAFTKFIAKGFGTITTWNQASILKSLGASLNDAMSLGSDKAKQFLAKGGAATKISAPSKVASIIMFGKEKVAPSQVSINDFVKAFPLSNMSQKSLDNIQKLVKEGEKAAKTLQKSYKDVQAAASTVKSAIEASANAASYTNLNKSVTALTSVSNTTRMLNVYMVGVLLNVHKEYLRLVSYCGVSARLLLKKSGKPKKGTEATPKKK